jgi:hypothetical protein
MKKNAECGDKENFNDIKKDRRKQKDKKLFLKKSASCVLHTAQ